MDKELLTKFQSVVNSLNRKNFSSHDFLKKFINMYEDDYREIFTVNTLQSTNAQIAKMLSENAKALGISKSDRMLSENFHGKKSVVQGWKILMVCLVAFTCASVSASAQTFSSVPNPEESNLTMFQMRSVIRDKDYLPQNLMIKGDISVVDTLKAQTLYEELKVGANKVNEELSRLTKLLSSKETKVTDKFDLALMNDALCWIKNFRPLLLEEKQGSIAPMFEDNIQKGKLTSQMKEYFDYYLKYLTDSVGKLQSKLSGGRWELAAESLPRKTISTSVLNPYYRGFNYNDSELLDLVETEQQQTWHFLYSSNYKKREDSYPKKMEYLSFDGHPQYKVTYYEDNYRGIHPEFVYDTKGNLVYVASLTRYYDSSPFQEIRRLVYLRDYQNNKYGIKSRSEKTQRYLQLILCRNNGFERTQSEAIASVFAAGLTSDLRYRGNTGKKIANGALSKVNVYNDSDGKRYIAQLGEDHASEFGIVYMIERLSNLSFRIVYLDTQLRPSHCATITYKTGGKPFTQELTGRLVSMPTNLPPLMNCSGEVYENVKKIDPSSFPELSDAKKSSDKDKASDKDVYSDVVEQMPMFPGGDGALIQYLSNNMEYPKLAAKSGMSGRVVVGFIVDEDGSITDIKLLRSVDFYLDEEAIRLVKSMPRWIPGRKNGVPVRVKFQIPFNFRLQ